jgi:hypothetical protein
MPLFLNIGHICSILAYRHVLPPCNSHVSRLYTIKGVSHLRDYYSRGVQGIIPSDTRSREFPTWNNSAEDGIDETNGLFRQNSGCSVEQKTLGFLSEPTHGRKNARNFVL